MAYVVRGKNGKVVGKYATRGEAERRIAQLKAGAERLRPFQFVSEHSWPGQPRRHAKAPRLIVVELRGGDAGDAKDAVCVDLDPGSNTRYEWRALVRPDRLDLLLNNSGAEQVSAPETWDGEPFGDGNGGTVELRDGKVTGNGLYSPALAAP